MYLFLRYGLASFFLIGWLLYQIFIKKKRWNEVSGEAMTIAFFVLLWCLIAYWAFH